MEKTKNPSAATARRKKFIAANWKMNKTNEKTAEFFKDFLSMVKPDDLSRADIAVCVPFTALDLAAIWLKDTSILSGAQNMHYETAGAFTGEISAEMLTELGTQCVIIGHSERRQYFGETDTAVNKKVFKALENNLLPIVCVGESLSEKESGLTEKTVEKQTIAALASVSAEALPKIVFAYEPVWAIGTGKTATAEDANNVIKHIRSVIKKLYDEKAAENVRILYGGSMNGKNAKELLSMSDIDGGLIGSAGLKPNDFYDIIKSI